MTLILNNSFGAYLSVAHDNIIVNKICAAHSLDNYCYCAAQILFSGPALLTHGFLFWFKLVFIIFLLLFYLWILFSACAEADKTKELKSMMGLKRSLQEYSVIISAFSVSYSTYLTHQKHKTKNIISDLENDIISLKENKLNLEKEIEKVSSSLGGLIEELKSLGWKQEDIHRKFKNVMFNVAEVKQDESELFKLTLELSKKVNVGLTTKEVLKISDRVKFDEAKQKLVTSSKTFQDNSDILLTELKVISTQVLPLGDSVRTAQEKEIPAVEQPTASTSSCETGIEIHKSSIVSLDWFENLNLVQQFSVSLLLFNSVVLSALVSIVFIYFGDYLLSKYQLEIKYPKLAKIILYRKKFSKYYFISSCLLIFFAAIGQITLGIALLSS